MDIYQLILNSFIDGCRSIARYNTSTRILQFIKYENVKTDPETAVYKASEFLDRFLSSGVIYKEDMHQFDLLTNDYLCQFAGSHESGTLISYRRLMEGRLIWTRLNVFVPDQYSDEQADVIIFNRDLPMEEAAMYESLALHSKDVHKVLKVNMTTDQITVIKEYPSEHYLHRKPKDPKFSAERRFIREGYVHPDDVPAFERHLDYARIRRHFAEGHADYSFYYRRRVRGLYRWVKLTILPASEHTRDSEVFFCYVTDSHKEILKLLDIQAATNYARYFSEKNRKFSEGYYENLLEIMSHFTHPYIDYYILDLDRDLFINYKLSKSFANKDISYVGNYTQTTEDYLKANYSGEEAKMLLQYASSAKLRELLKDKMTLSYTFRYPNGQLVTTTCLKIESRNGIPTKLICTTLPCEQEEKLTIKTFGNFEVTHPDGTPLHFSRKQSKQLLAYLVDRQGYPVTSKDIVLDVLEKEATDLNAIKYVSTMTRRLIEDLKKEGYPNIIIKEQKTLRLNVDAVNCDYYHFLDGDTTYWRKYHNEYMKEYSFAEETNAELLHITNK